MDLAVEVLSRTCMGLCQADYTGDMNVLTVYEWRPPRMLDTRGGLKRAMKEAKRVAAILAQKKKPVPARRGTGGK